MMASGTNWMPHFDLLWNRGWQ